MFTRHYTAQCPTADAVKEAAFGLALLQWRTLGADRQRWLDPEKQRELAAAFLRYHAAKLALEADSLRLSSSRMFPSTVPTVYIKHGDLDR